MNRSSEPARLTGAVQDVVSWLFEISTGGGVAALEPEVEGAARLLLLDTLGCMIGGAAKPELVALNSALATVDPGSIKIPGMGEPLSASGAAYWSAMAATWDEACEGLARAHGRPGLHAFPVALGLTFAGGGSLGDAILALVRGYEVGGRLGERLRIRPGMHVDGTWGTFGAVTAACSALGHGATEAMASIEAAACQTPMSLYLPVGQGATIRNSYVAEAARRAIGLSLSVGAGVTTPSGALEAFENLALDSGAATVDIAPAGEWLITQGYLKPYAAVRHVHYGAEAALAWHRRGRSSTTIEAIELDVYPEAITYCGNRAPQTPIAAQFSLSYGIARMLFHGDLGPDSYTSASLRDPEVHRLEQLIDVRGVPGATPDQRYATLRVTTASGDVESITVDRVSGDADQAMSADEVVAKFTGYSAWLPPPWSAERVATAVIEGPLGTPLAEAIGG